MDVSWRSLTCVMQHQVSASNWNIFMKCLFEGCHIRTDARSLSSFVALRKQLEVGHFDDYFAGTQKNEIQIFGAEVCCLSAPIGVAGRITLYPHHFICRETVTIDIVG